MADAPWLAGFKFTAAELLKVVRVAAPAAGAEWSQRVPGGELWLPLAVVATLTSSATAISRAAILQVTDGSDVLYELPTGLSQGATRRAVYSWIAELGSGQSFNAVVAGTPALIDASVSAPAIWLPPGFVLQTSTGQIRVDDQWSAIRLLIAFRLVERSSAEPRRAPRRRR